MKSFIAFVGTAEPVQQFNFAPNDPPLNLCGSRRAADAQRENAMVSAYPFEGAMPGKPDENNPKDLAATTLLYWSWKNRKFTSTSEYEPMRLDLVLAGAMGELREKMPNAVTQPARRGVYQQAIELIKEGAVAVPGMGGNIYTVAVDAVPCERLDEDAKLILDWHLPIKEQGVVWEKIQDDYAFDGQESGQFVFEQIMAYEPCADRLKVRTTSVRDADRTAEAREYLVSKGIVGCRTLDEDSRFVIQPPTDHALPGSAASFYRAWRGDKMPAADNEYGDGFDLLEWGTDRDEVLEAVLARAMFNYAIYDSSCLTITRRNGVEVPLALDSQGKWNTVEEVVRAAEAGAKPHAASAKPYALDVEPVEGAHESQTL